MIFKTNTYRLVLVHFIFSLFSLLPGVVNATLYTTNVPFISQRNGDPGTSESACAPTSVAMILKHYFPNASLDLKDVYHSGTQNYVYSGPLSSYTNVSNMNGTPLLDNWPRPQPACSHYSTNNSNCAETSIYTGATPDGIKNYLIDSWQFTVGTATTEQQVYQELRAGRPLIGRVYALGNIAFGHYVVIRGYDDNNTPNNFLDDTIYVNDPYDTGWPDRTSGNNRAISHNDFFVASSRGQAWFREAITLQHTFTATERANTVLVDIAHSTHGGGNNDKHTFSVSDSTQWRYYYDGKGHDWAYTSATNQNARWTPGNLSPGRYDIYVKYMADATSGNATYSVHGANSDALATKSIFQYANASAWSSTLIGQNVSLGQGAYVRATNISPSTNIDQVLFVYRGEATSASLTSEQSALLSVNHQASWGYFRDPTTLNWLISNQQGTTYILSGSNGYSGQLTWGEVAAGASTASMSFSQNTVAISSSAGVLTSNPFRGFTVNGGIPINVPSSRSSTVARSVAGQTLPISWYFFRLETTGAWYIVDLTTGQPRVLRLRLNTDFSDYDWLQVDTTGWRVQFNGAQTFNSIRFYVP